MAGVFVKKIEFHEAQSATYYYRGSGPHFEIPEDTPAVTVDFGIEDFEGRVSEWTEVLIGPLDDYNDIVDQAFAHLKQRLLQMPKIAEMIKDRPER